MQTQTRTDCFAPPLEWLNALDNWEAAARWNAMAFEWMTTGWRNWLELVTVWPALEAPAQREAVEEGHAVTPAPAGTQDARNARAVHAQAADSRLRGKVAEKKQKQARPAAKPASRRAPAKRPARPQAAARPTRSRG